MYESAFLRAREAAARLPPENRSATILGLGAAQRRLLLENLTPDRSTCHALIDAAREAAPSGRSLALAEDALLVASSIGSDHLLVAAGAEFANAVRLTGDLPAAGAVINALRRLLLTSAVDPLTRGRVYAVAASIHNQSRNHQLAIRYARRALSLYRSCEQRDEECRLLIKLALLHGNADQPERGLPLVKRALDLASALADGQLQLSAIHNVAYLLVELGLWRPALDALNAGRPFYNRHAAHLMTVQASWLRCRIAQGRGDVETARQGMEVVCASLASMDLPWQYAIASLHLGLMHCAASRWADAHNVALGLVPLFKAMRVPDATIAALRIEAEADIRMIEAIEQAIRAVRCTPHRPVRLTEC